MMKALITKKLEASTILEVITASIIFMIIFAMSIDSLTRLVLSGEQSTDYVLIENDIQRCRNILSGNSSDSDEQILHYKWGTIKVTISDYKEQVYYTTIEATPYKGNRKIIYSFLIPAQK